MAETTSDVPSDQPRAGYLPSLDSLRLIAVGIVMLAHFGVSRLLPGGFGVTIFFAISGFLILRLLLAEENLNGAFDLGQFFFRRVRRLMPPMLIMLAISAPAYAIFEPKSFNVSQIVLAIFYLGNVPAVLDSLGFKPFGPGADAYGVLWSLAVEEHFYLLLPFILLLFRGFQARLSLIIAVLLGSLALRIICWLTLSGASDFNYYFTITRLDSIAWGCLLTLVLSSNNLVSRQLGKMRSALWLFGSIAVLLAGITLRNDFFQDTLRYTVHGAGMFALLNVLVFSASLPRIRALTELGWVRFGGRISYELYLWHKHVFHLFANYIHSYTLLLAASFAGSILVSYFSVVLTRYILQVTGLAGGRRLLTVER